MAGFQQLIVAQVHRAQNKMADALAILASSTLYLCHFEISIMDHPFISNVVVLTIASQPGHSWMSSISSYLRNSTLPKDRRKTVKVKAKAAQYTLINDTLYKRSFSGPYHRCVTPVEAEHIMEQVHKGICGTHIGRQSLCHRILT